MTLEHATKIVRTIDCNNPACAELDIFEDAKRIRDRYNALKQTTDYHSAGEQARAEWLQEHIADILG